MSLNWPKTANDLTTSNFTPASSLTGLPQRVVLATYNIRYAVGAWLLTNGLRRQLLRQAVAQPRVAVVQRNLARAALGLRGQTRFPAPDIIALQEADSGTQRAGGVQVADELARALAYHYVYAPSHLPRSYAAETRQWYLAFEENITPADTGDTGVALLSRCPLINPTRLDLPWRACPWRPRLGLAADFSWGASGQRLRVITAHLDPHAPLPHQLAQQQILLDYAAQTAGPCVILGDFNTLTPGTRRVTRHFLTANGFQTFMPNGTPTWRAGFFTNHTDWFFVRDVRVIRWGVARAVRSASDHWPVWLEVDY